MSIKIPKHYMGSSRTDPLTMDQYYRKDNQDGETVSLPKSRYAELRTKQLYLSSGIDEQSGIKYIPQGLINTVTEMFKNSINKKLQEKGRK